MQLSDASEQHRRPWKIPEPRAVLQVRAEDGTTIAVRRHGNPEGPRLVLSHGNGLAIDLYYPFWSLLVARFDLLVFDFRNHGWNPIGPREHHNVQVFISDCRAVAEAIDRHFGPKPKIGVFHSISALTALLQVLEGVEYAGLFLFDPPLHKPGTSIASYDVQSIRCGKAIRRRAVEFESKEQFSEVLRFSPFHCHLDADIKDLFAETTLRRSEGRSGYMLRCPPSYEAQAVDHLSAWAVLVELDSLPCPTKVLGADPMVPYAYLPSCDLSEILTIDYDFIPDTSHLVQLEQPGKCAELMLEFLETHHLLDD